MYKVKCLKDFGSWAKKGKIVELNNWMTKTMERRGIVEVIEFLGNHSYSKYYLVQGLNNMKAQLEQLKKRLKGYEKKLKEVQNE